MPPLRIRLGWLPGLMSLLVVWAAIGEAAGSPGPLHQPITANFREVDFQAAVNFFAESAGVNIVLSPKARELGKPVTLRLMNIPLQRALEYLVKGQSLVFRLDDTAIFVATLDEMKAEPLETKVVLLQQGPGLFADFEPLVDTRQSVALQAVGIRKMKTIKDVLDAVIPQVTGSSIALDERSGSLVITHVPYYHQQVERLLDQLDVLPTEIQIEARFIELTMTDTNEWNFDEQLNSDASLTKKEAGNRTLGSGLQLSRLGSKLLRGTGIAFSRFSRQTAGEGLNLTLQGVLTKPQYQAVLHALAETKRAKTLSAPQVTTLNNQTATIKIVTEYVYASTYKATVTRQDLNADGDFNDVVSGVRETRFVNVPQDFVTKDLGILLNVTPSIGHDLKAITLALKPEVTERSGDDKFGGEVTLPRFTTRNLETTVVIEDGETVVLGGLMQDTTSKTVTKVPVLGSLPVVGILFQRRDDSVKQSNLVIFVSARVIHPTKPLASAPLP